MNNAGQSITGMGLLAIIAVVILLIVAIRSYAKLRRAQGQHEEAAQAVAPDAPVQPTVEEGIAPEIVAAIAAAIAALSAGHKPLVVRSIRRADGWSKSARAEQIYRF